MKVDNDYECKPRYSVQLSYQQALHEVPQLRNIAKLYYSKQYSLLEIRELDELQAIIRLQSSDLFIGRRRFNYLINKFHVKELKVVYIRPNKQTFTTLPRYEKSDKLISHIYHSPYKHV